MRRGIIAAVDGKVLRGLRSSVRAARARRGGLGVIVAMGLAATLLAVGVPAGGALELNGGSRAPALNGSDGAVYWTAVGHETSYVVATSDAPRDTSGRTTRYVTVPRAAGTIQSYRPTEPQGQIVYVGVSADGGVSWSPNEARVRVGGAPSGGGGAPEPPTVPAPPPVIPPLPAEPPAESPPATEGPGLLETPGLVNLPEPRMIIGVNDASGWGVESARLILGGHITWDRFSVKAWAPATQTSLSYGFNVLGIVANLGDSTALAAVEPLAWGNEVVNELTAHPQIAIAEAGNEMYLKAGTANPAQYGRMYLAAVKAMRAKHIHVPLLFNMIGDYPHGTWSSPKGWSEDAKGGGWLRDAVNAVPGLASAILENGISIHPYGALSENNHDNWGVLAAAADERVAQAVLGAIPPFYITEFGYDLARCGRDLGACTKLEQASKLRAAYKAFEADPHVFGIWWYESHDDSTGRWGLLNSNNTKRPAFGALSYLAKLARQ
jgi:hypothetical protein